MGKNRKLTYAKWMDILPLIDGNSNVLALSLKSKVTHSYCVDILLQFVNMGWASSKKVGRERHYFLTGKGQETLLHVTTLKSALDRAYPKPPDKYGRQ